MLTSYTLDTAHGPTSIQESSATHQQIIRAAEVPYRPIPHRVVLTGGFLDQPFVSQLHPGSGITLSIEPIFEIKENSGMASSTRRTAMDIWDDQLPSGNPEKLAKILSCCENPPGTKVHSGSLDPIGLIYPALTKAHYTGEYWPESIERIDDEEILKFVEELIYLVPIRPRPTDYNILKNSNVTRETAKNLADATEVCWRAILAQDAKAFGQSVTASFYAVAAMFPQTLTANVTNAIEKYHKQALGWKVTGAGGGGYLILISQEPIEEGIRVTARRGS